MSIMNCWIQMVLGVVVYENGSIKADIQSSRIIQGPRPKTAEDFKAKRENIAHVAQRKPGTHRILCRLGAGCGIILQKPFECLKLTEKSRMEKFHSSFPNIIRDKALILFFRDLAARNGWLKFDTFNGVAQTVDPIAAGMPELAELGLFNTNGWVRYILPKKYSYCQTALNAEQERYWGIIKPELPCAFEGKLEPVMTARDTINGHPCILAFEPESGAVDAIFPMFLSVPSGNNFIMRDMELLERYRDEKLVGFDPLNRNPYIITKQVDDLSPIATPFGHVGLDIRSPTFEIGPDKNAHLLSDKSARMLELFKKLK